MTNPETVARTPYCHKIRYGITGAPIITEDEMDGTHAPGVGVRPTLIEFVYSAARDGKPASVSASVTGSWTRFGAPDPDGFGGQMTTHFVGDPSGWPAWLAKEARLHEPAVSVPPPATRADDRAALLTEAADGLLRLRDTLITEPDVTGKYLAGIERSAKELRRLAAEAPTTTQPETGSCAHCGKNIRCITGTLAAWWVHTPYGNTACNPEHAADSPRATPKPDRCPHGCDTSTCPCLACEADGAAATVHAVPLPGSDGISSCCGRPPCEFVGERVTRDPAKVTCAGPAAEVRQDGAQP